MGISGGLTPDNIGVEYCCVIYAFDESPLERGVFWAGTNDGLVHVSRDGGAAWTDVTGNIPDLPPDGVVRGIDASRHAPGKAYMVVEHHQVGRIRGPRLPNRRLRRELDRDRGRHRRRRAQLHAEHPRGPRAPRPALPGHRGVAVRVVRRRRAMAVPSHQPAPRAHVRARRSGAFQRPGDRHLRPRLLDSRRRDAPAAAHPRWPSLPRISSPEAPPTASGPSRSPSPCSTTSPTARIRPTAPRSTIGSPRRPRTA